MTAASFDGNAPMHVHIALVVHRVREGVMPQASSDVVDRGAMSNQLNDVAASVQVCGTLRKCPLRCDFVPSN